MAWRCCARWMHGALIFSALALAPPLGACHLAPAVTAPARPAPLLIAPQPAARVAVATTSLAADQQVARIIQLVEFNADGRVIGVCLVVVHRDSTRLEMPFSDPALTRPSLRPPRCQ